MTIKLTDVAKYYDELPHQVNAWNWLQGEVDPSTLESFATKYRNAPKLVTYTNDWNGVMAAGKAAGAKYPEVVAAQWALESAWGKHVSGTHNYFG